MKTLDVLTSLLIAALWGIPPVAKKYALNYVSYEFTIVFATIIHVVLSSIFFLFYYKNIIPSFRKLDIKVSSALIASSIFGSFIPTILFLKLLKDNKSSIITTLTSVTPVFVVLFAFFILKEKISLKAFIAIILVVIGMFILSET